MIGKLFFLSLSGLLLFTLPVTAQIATKTGSIYGNVVDEKAVPLSDVTVTLQSDFTATQSAKTGSSGSFRFANLPPATYTTVFSLEGFTQVRQEDIRVTTGGTVELQTVIKPSLVEQVTVIAEPPLVDSRKTGIDWTFSREHLQQIPNGRNPWSLITMTACIDSERFNTGLELGQAFFYARGGKHQNNVWNYDGVNHTDCLFRQNGI